MAVFQGIEQSSFGLRSDSRQWWSPLSPADVSATLLKLGASRVSRARARTRWAVALSDDAFVPSLVFESAPLDRGTCVRVQVEQVGFGRDFSLVIQLALTVFAALFAVSASWTFRGLPTLDVLLAIATVWAGVMASFAGLRALVSWVAGRCSAYELTCSKVRVALFAQKA